MNSVAAVVAFARAIRDGSVSAADIREAYADFKANADVIKAELSKMTKAELGKYARSYSDEKKEGMVKSAFSSLCTVFASDSLTYGFNYGYDPASMARSMAEALDKSVAQWTDAKIQADAAERQAAKDARASSLSDPKTVEDFRLLVEKLGRSAPTVEEAAAFKKLKDRDFELALMARGESKLSAEQLERYDALRGINRHALRQAEEDRAATLRRVAGLSDTSIQISKHFHTKHAKDTWIVQLGDRVDAVTFKELAKKARQLGGNYGREWKPTQTPAGFVFDSEANAQRFAALQTGSVDRSADIAERREERTESAAEHLREVAERMTERANEQLGRDRKENTHRRADMAASITMQALSEKALAETLENLAAALERGECRHLILVKNRAQVQSLNAIYRTAEWNACRADPARTYGNNPNCTDIPAVQVIAAVEFPWPYFHASSLRDLIRKGAVYPGAKMLAARLQKWLGTSNEDGYCNNATVIETVRQLVNSIPLQSYDRGQWQDRMAGYRHCLEMNLPDLPSLRAALREYIELRKERSAPDPIKAAERAMVGTQIEGYWPTPATLANRVVAAADIRPGNRVLEPSAGKGDLADAVRRACPSAEIDVIEQAYSLRNILKLKGYSPLGEDDFLRFRPEWQYDRIVMNPPFEGLADIDHVQHAFSMLAPGGRLVAIMSQSPFFRSDRKAVAFRAWLAQVGGSATPNPAGSFATAEAARTTSVATQTVVIDAPALKRRRAEVALPVQPTAGQGRLFNPRPRANSRGR